MKTSEKYLTYYNSISEDIRFISNSLIRLKILKVLFDEPSNMKELTDKTNLKYSSVSITLHGLELRGMVYRKSNKYCLVNSIKMQMENIVNLSIVINLLEEIFNIIAVHVVDRLPEKSILELYLLDKVELFESDGINVDGIINFIENTLKDADGVRCILPIYTQGFSDILNGLAEDGKYVEINVSKDLFEVYGEKTKVKYLSSFESEKNFLLVVTNETMILGFFKNDGIFDKNRILVSNSGDALEWAINLFKNFKEVI